MIKSLLIKKIVAAFMLIVFAFSITPTIILHNWLANHTDTYKKYTDTKTQQVGNKTFNCHCDNIVAESPFTQPSFANIPVLQNVFTVVQNCKTLTLLSSLHFYFSLRGPPAV